MKFIRRIVTPPRDARASDRSHAMTVARKLFSNADGASVATVHSDEDGDARAMNARARAKDERDDDGDDGDASRAGEGALAGVSPITPNFPRVAIEDESETWTSPRPTAEGEASFRFDSTFDTSPAREMDDDASFESANATMAGLNMTFESVDAHDATFHSVMVNRSTLSDDFEFDDSKRAEKKKFRARVETVIRAVMALVGGFVVAREVAARVSAKMEARERRRK